MCPLRREMVYHEVRKIKGENKHYLIHNARKKGKWVKRARYIGVGNISGRDINEEKRKFEKEIMVGKQYKYLKNEEINHIEDLKEQYNEKINSMQREEYKKFQKSFFTELTYDSNAIEGSSLSLQETSLIINEGLVPEGKTLREVYEARNHAKALKFIKEYGEDLDESFILKIHKIIMDGISERFTGRYRETQVRIFGSNVKFPQAYMVQQLVKNLIYWYKKNKKEYHQFELAIIVSMKLVTIHPFIDGNGRVSRLVMNFLLGKKKYPWINIYNKRRQKYLEAVRKANDEDYSMIAPFLVNALEENLKDFGII